MQGLGEQREHAVGERSELPLSSGSCAPWSSVNNCTEGSKSGVKGSTLAKELSRMGLYASNAALLQHGSIINAGGQYVRLVSDWLIVTRHWPGQPAHRRTAANRCGEQLMLRLKKPLMMQRHYARNSSECEYAVLF